MSPMVLCDGCSVLSRMSVRDAEHAATPEGWRFVRFTDTPHLLCPDCLNAGDEWVRDLAKHPQRLDVVQIRETPAERLARYIAPERLEDPA